MINRGEINIHLVLTIFLGFGMVLFGVLAALAYRDKADLHATFDQRVGVAVAQAVKKQKGDDDIANTKANEQPFRTYTADQVNGAFQLQIPKNWSIYAGKNTTGTAQLNLMVDPDVVNDNIGQQNLNAHAFHLQLLNRTVADVNRDFEQKLKTKKVTSKGMTVSGISATRFEGAIDDNRHQGVAVTLPVRDKTMLITSETNTSYLAEFDSILASSKINP